MVTLENLANNNVRFPTIYQNFICNTCINIFLRLHLLVWTNFVNNLMETVLIKASSIQFLEPTSIDQWTQGSNCDLYWVQTHNSHAIFFITGPKLLSLSHFGSILNFPNLNTLGHHQKHLDQRCFYSTVKIRYNNKKFHVTVTVLTHLPLYWLIDGHVTDIVKAGWPQPR